MQYRKIGNTELNVSIVGIGTHQFAGEWGKKFNQLEVLAILNTANEFGINILDTAPNYGDHLSEKLIGKALVDNRDEWIIATKFGQKLNNSHNNIHDFSVNSILNQLDESLKSLKTDYIDIYQFHSGTNKEYDNDDIWEILHKQVEKGKIRYLGVSMLDTYVKNNDLYQIENMKKFNADILQVVYNKLNSQPENEILPYCSKNNISVISRVPLAKGFLSGKYAINDSFSSKDIRSNYGLEANQKMLFEVDRIRNTELPPGINMAQWSIAWCLKNNIIKTVIPGVKNTEQVKLNARSISLLD